MSAVLDQTQLGSLGRTQTLGAIVTPYDIEIQKEKKKQAISGRNIH